MVGCEVNTILSEAHCQGSTSVKFPGPDGLPNLCFKKWNATFFEYLLNTAFVCHLFSRPLPITRIMHTSPVWFSADTMSNMTVLDTADPYDLDMTSDKAIYPVSFQVMLQPHISDIDIFRKLVHFQVIVGS